jgi:hypothetical protein
MATSLRTELEGIIHDKPHFQTTSNMTNAPPNVNITKGSNITVTILLMIVAAAVTALMVSRYSAQQHSYNFPDPMEKTQKLELDEPLAETLVRQKNEDPLFQPFN